MQLRQFVAREANGYKAEGFSTERESFMSMNHSEEASFPAPLRCRAFPSLVMLGEACAPIPTRSADGTVCRGEQARELRSRATFSNSELRIGRGAHAGHCRIHHLEKRHPEQVRITRGMPV